MDKYYINIKNELINNEITKRVKDYSKNKSDLDTYYNVGKLLNEAGKHYGQSIIKKYSIQLTKELGKGYTYTSLTRMKKFYNLILKIATVSQQLSYGHYVELLSIRDIDEIKYYINICVSERLSIRDLRKRISSKEFERLDKKTKLKIINNKKLYLTDSIKNPVIINNNDYKIITEKVLQKLILEDISSFLKELGSGFTYVDNEYKIRIGDRYNYIDLLLFNIKYNCYVVIELKIAELKKEHIGQIQTYMNYIDKNIKEINHNNTIGIIICKKNNRYIIEYCSDKRIISREYLLI